MLRLASVKSDYGLWLGAADRLSESEEQMLDDVKVVLRASAKNYDRVNLASLKLIWNWCEVVIPI